MASYISILPKTFKIDPKKIKHLTPNRENQRRSRFKVNPSPKTTFPSLSPSFLSHIKCENVSYLSQQFCKPKCFRRSLSGFIEQVFEVAKDALHILPEQQAQKKKKSMQLNYVSLKFRFNKINNNKKKKKKKSVSEQIKHLRVKHESLYSYRAPFLKMRTLIH